MFCSDKRQHDSANDITEYNGYNHIKLYNIYIYNIYIINTVHNFDHFLLTHVRQTGTEEDPKILALGKAHEDRLPTPQHQITSDSVCQYDMAAKNPSK